jgi:broad specificity phosphatase PhoE
MRTRVGSAMFWLVLLTVVSLQAVVAQQTTVILVRHAEKADAPATDPPLTEVGQARAKRLADALKNAGVSAIYVTDFKRTQETAAPIAAALSVPTNTAVTAGGAGQYAASLAQRIQKDHKGKTVLVVGHSNTTPEVIKALGGPALPVIPDSDYDNLFVVVIGADGKASLIRAKY